MLDLIERVRDGTGCEVDYIWFDTGLEYRATKEHLDYLEDRYGIDIIRYKAKKSIPACVKEYGQPFHSKYTSTHMERLQKHGFQWEDEPYEVLLERYPDCISSVKWWCNKWTRFEGRPGWFDIGRSPGLKEFIVANPPEFRISNKCCEYAKKRVAKDAYKELGADLECIGIRKMEGGARAGISQCFTRHEDRADTYRPLLWYKVPDLEDYRRIFGIRRSDCYEVWGFKRTGCVGCPFGRKVLDELAIAERYEPRLARAARKVFADSYEYTRQFREFAADMGQMRLSL